MSQYLDKDGASRIAENFLSKQAEQDAILQNLQFDLKEVEHALVKTIQGPAPLNIRALTRPLDDYRISGNMNQNGVPTPSAPIYPEECGVRTGNLFSSTWEQGSIDGTTGQNINAESVVRTKDYIPITPNITYSFSRNLSNGYMNLRLYRADKSYIGPGSDSIIRLISGTSAGNPMGINVPFCCFEVIDSEAAYIRFNDASNSTATKWHMVEGEYTRQTMPEYEPYGYKLPISCGGTTTNVYLGEQSTTRRIKKLVLTGEEGWTITSNGVLRIALSGQLRSSIPLCTHYLGSNSSAWSNVPDKSVTVSISGYLAILDTTYTTAADFKSYLSAQYAAGTPVTVWYVIAEPETGIVNEPLHKIGGYADTVSMAQAGVEISTTKGFNAITTDTTVFPSNIEVKGVINNA